MKLIFISDTHGCHRELDLPPCDLIIHAGDICNKGNIKHVSDFISWYEELDIEHKIFIQGNHDRDFNQNNQSIIPEKIPDNLVYLHHSLIEIRDWKIWGSPFQENTEINTWDMIPNDIDIVITHNPPYGILDKAPSGNLRGCNKLRSRIHQISPRLHLFGHIHHSYGKIEKDKTTYMNGSNYEAGKKKLTRPYFILDLPDEK